MIPTEDLALIARAINNSRPQTLNSLSLKVADAQVDRTARSVADALWPREVLTQSCTRRIFLVSAGLDDKAAAVRPPCTGRTGCARDAGPNVS